ncbi:MAG: TadE/TadG family type IV pilus assembly protein [Phycisphaeraceae bacterium]
MRSLVQSLVRFHRDDRGAEGLEKLLIIAAIVLPLLGVLIFFRDEIGDWIDGLWSDMRGDADSFGGPQP